MEDNVREELSINELSSSRLAERRSPPFPSGPFVVPVQIKVD